MSGFIGLVLIFPQTYLLSPSKLSVGPGKANIDLGYAVAFPIIGSLPGIVGLAIGVAFFGEACRHGFIRAIL